MTTTAMAVLLAAGATVTTASSASAEECHGSFCGAVKNRTSRIMHVTRIPGEGDNKCDVWNQHDVPLESFHSFSCHQEEQRNGIRGGNYSGDDVDAFTFNFEGYHERFSRVGKWHWRTKGVWTKIPDGAIADCGIGDHNQVWCTVLVQARI